MAKVKSHLTPQQSGVFVEFSSFPHDVRAVQDWDAMEQLYAHAFSQCLFVDAKEHPLVCADPVMNTRAGRERQCQLLFERFESPALFLASTAVLNAFATGRTTALVLDVGSSVTSCVPVFEGFKLQKGMGWAGGRAGDGCVHGRGLVLNVWFGKGSDWSCVLCNGLE